MAKCKNCGAKLEKDAAFCSICGVQVKKANHAKMIAAVAVCICAIVAVVFFMLRGKSNTVSMSADRMLIYISEEGMNLLDPKTGKTTLLEDKIPEKMLFWDCQYTDDDKYAIYVYDQKIHIINLKARNESDRKIETIKNAGLSYDLFGHTLVYCSSDDLYKYNIDTKEKIKLERDVTGYKISDNKKKILYLTSSGNLGITGMDGNGEKKLDTDIVGNISSISTNDDFSMIYYIKDGNLMSVKDAGDRQKIRKATEILGNYKNGKGVYYSCLNKNNYPDNMDQDIYDYYFANKGLIMDVGLYDGAVDTTIITNAIDFKNFSNSSLNSFEVAYNLSNTPVWFSLDDIDLSSIKKMDIDEVTYKDIYGLTADMYVLGNKNYYQINTELSSMFLGELQYGDKNEYYLLTEKVRSQNVRTYDKLYALTPSGKKLKKKIVDDNMQGAEYLDSIFNECSYYKDVSRDGLTGTLYCRGKEIAENVQMDYTYSVNGAWYYYTDCNKSGTSGTLMKIKGGKKEVLSEDAGVFLVLRDGSVAVLEKYSAKKQAGDLKLIKNGKKTDVEDDVKEIPYGQKINLGLGYDY